MSTGERGYGHADDHEKDHARIGCCHARLHSPDWLGAPSGASTLPLRLVHTAPLYGRNGHYVLVTSMARVDVVARSCHLLTHWLSRCRSRCGEGEVEPLRVQPVEPWLVTE